MDALPKSRLLRFVERAMVLARRAVSRFSTRYSRKRFTLRQHVVLLCLKVKKTTTYRDLVDELIEMPRIRDALDLEIQVQAWYDGWRVRIEHAWADPMDTLAEGFDTKDAALDYAEEAARKWSDYDR